MPKWLTSMVVNYILPLFDKLIKIIIEITPSDVSKMSTDNNDALFKSYVITLKCFMGLPLGLTQLRSDAFSSKIFSKLTVDFSSGRGPKIGF